MTPAQWLYQVWRRVLPRLRPASIVAWAAENVKLVGSVKSETYNPDITPWTKEPIECTDNGTRRGTFVKPIQTGGSEVGIIGILWRIAMHSCGDIQYNWPNDDKAKEKWAKQIEKKLKACRPVMERVVGKLTWQKGLVVFPHLNFTVQGVYTDSKVTSDSVTFQVNEELHDEEGGWSPGRHEQALGRLTAVWNSVAFDISNAGRKGGELHQAFLAGTQQHWEIRCPGCRQFHRMRTRWDPKRPDLGGLRYDSDGCKLENGDYDYNRMLSSIRMQLACGYLVPDDATVRRALSLSGRYSGPTNPGAQLIKRSWTLEGVSIDYIPFLDLIQQKHKALKAMRYSDYEPWNVYLRERECQFASDETRPTMQTVTLSSSKTDRAGLPHRTHRFGAGDRQQGSYKAGEFPHWWVVIADIATTPDGRIHIYILFEGKILTNEDLVATFSRFEVPPGCVTLDSSWDPVTVYHLCLLNGYNAIKGAEQALFTHPDGGRKIFSVEKPLHTMTNSAPKYDYIVFKGELIPDPREPLFWFYVKSGLMERIHWARTSPDVYLEIPADVSEDFISHMDAWTREVKTDRKTNEEKPQWTQHKKRDDLLVCLSYLLMQMEMASLIGAAVANLPPPKP